MKTKCILHGGFTSEDNELNRSFFEEITKDLADGSNVLLIYFSRKDDEVPELFEEDKQRVLKQAGNKKLHITFATKENFADQLKEADALYMRGGDTAKLIAALQEVPNFKDLVKSKVVSGSSAGAYAIGTYSAGHSVNYVREGMGLAPLRVVCHHESSQLPPTEESVEKLKETAQDLELVYLKDHEWIVLEVNL